MATAQELRDRLQQKRTIADENFAAKKIELTISENNSKTNLRGQLNELLAGLKQVRQQEPLSTAGNAALPFNGQGLDKTSSLT